MPVPNKWLHRYLHKPGKWVFVPSEESKTYGEAVKLKIENKWCAPEYFYHFRKGGHVSALRYHLKKKYYSRLDVQDFFGSINSSRVTRSLKPYFGYDTAREIATKSSVVCPDETPVKHMLPFGFVQSALLASLCLDKSAFGIYLKKLSKDKKLRISVYMDDVIVSSNNKKYLKTVTQNLKEEAIKSKWKLNTAKEVDTEEIITAFNILLKRSLIELTQARLDRFVEAYDKSESENKRLGIKRYVSSVNVSQLSVFNR